MHASIMFHSSHIIDVLGESICSSSQQAEGVNITLLFNVRRHAVQNRFNPEKKGLYVLCTKFGELTLNCIP